MKFFTLTFFAANTTASGHSLRGDFEADVMHTSDRNLQDCVGRSSYLGCFRDRNRDRAMPHEVDGRRHSAEDCETECTKTGYMYFARQWKGQCFCSNDSTYDKHGSTSGCDCCEDNVGGGKMCVWKAEESASGCDENGAPTGPYLGCFSNKNRDRALPHQVDGRDHSATDCHDACATKGMKYFAREWKGQCFCSEDSDYSKHGIESNCDCCGSNVGGNKMCVWSV